MQYFYDRDEDTFHANDLVFPNAKFGMAVGFASDNHGGKGKPLSLTTRDGGKTWETQKLPDAGVSAFFLNESLGWLVGEKGVWRTEEGGRDWKRLKIPKEANVVRVCFKDDQHGWAVGKHKTVIETRDGGKTWNDLAEASKPSTNPDYTTYSRMEWVNSKSGIILGFGMPPRRDDSDKPAWLEPDKASRRRQWPTMTIAIETQDGGATWSAQSAPAFGVTTHFRATVDGYALALIRFTESFDYPSEVYVSKPRGGGSARVFREKNRMVTDVAWWTPAKALIAAIEPPGQLHQLPVPGKLHILTSTTLTKWDEMKVDYRAFGQKAMLAVVDEKNIWAGTDTGQILKLVS